MRQQIDRFTGEKERHASHENSALTTQQWERQVKHSFFEWINTTQVGWACITLKGRVTPSRLYRSEVELIKQQAISVAHLGRPFSMAQLETGFARCIHQMNFMFLPKRDRKRGRSLYCVPIEGGNPQQGVMNHIHALIEIPETTGFDEFANYMKLITPKKMASVFPSHRRNRVETDLWCQRYDPKGGNFLRYTLRNEGNATLSVNFDKVIVQLLTLPPTGSASK